MGSSSEYHSSPLSIICIESAHKQCDQGRHVENRSRLRVGLDSSSAERRVWHHTLHAVTNVELRALCAVNQTYNNARQLYKRALTH